MKQWIILCVVLLLGGAAHGTTTEQKTAQQKALADYRVAVNAAIKAFNDAVAQFNALTAADPASPLRNANAPLTTVSRALTDSGVAIRAVIASVDAIVPTDPPPPIPPVPPIPGTILASLPPNTAVNLGLYGCDSFPDGCTNIAAYSRFTYDQIGNRMLWFGGGHAAVQRTDVDVFDMNTLKWASAYQSTPCSAMTVANWDADGPVWRSTGHPVSRHTYDAMTFATSTGELILPYTETGGGNSCTPSPIQAPGALRWMHYNPVTKVWSKGGRSTTSIDQAEYDPVSGKIIAINQQFVTVYDPVTRISRDVIDMGGGAYWVNQITQNIGYTGNLVYFPPTDKMYVINRGNRVYEMTLDRADFSKTVTVEVKGITGTPPPRGALAAGIAGFAYDAVNRLIGGAVSGGKIYAYDPVGKVWHSRTMQTAPGAAVGNMSFLNLDFSVTDGVYIFVTTDMRTWAYRWGDPDPNFALTRVKNLRSGADDASVQDALGRAQDGDTLLVEPGIRYLPVNVTKPITIKAALPGQKWETRNAVFNGEGQLVVNTSSYNGPWPLKVVIEDGIFRSTNPPYSIQAGIYALSAGRGSIDLTVRGSLLANHANCLFSDYRGGADTKITVENTRIEDCGDGGGLTHNVYVSSIGEFNLTDVWSVKSRFGHLMKTRARKITIKGGAFLGEDSKASATLDFAHGGDVNIDGAVLTKGPNSDNAYFFIFYGREAYGFDPGGGGERIHTGYVDRFTMRNTLMVNFVANPGMTFIDFGLDYHRNIAVSNTSIPADVRGRIPTTDQMGPIIIENNVFAGDGAQAMLAKFPNNKVVPLSQIERYIDAQGRESYRVKEAP